MADTEPKPITPPAEGDRVLGVVNYVLILIGIPTSGVLMLVALIFAYVRLDQSTGWIRTHFIYQIRTIWGGLAFAVAGWLTIWIFGLGALIWAVGAVWVLVRGAVGLIRLVDGRGHADPRAFLF